MSTTNESQIIRAMENEWCAVLVERLAHRSNPGSNDRVILEAAAQVIRTSCPKNIRATINTATLPWHPDFSKHTAP